MDAAVKRERRLKAQKSAEQVKEIAGHIAKALAGGTSEGVINTSLKRLEEEVIALRSIVNGLE